MVDPDHIVSAVLPAGIATCFAYGYLAGRDAGGSRGAVSEPSATEAEDSQPPARAWRRTAARQLRTGRPAADRSPGTARPQARRRPRRRTRWNP